jgi:glycosyltransferase involved in cell wall biosynthesis
MSQARFVIVGEGRLRERLEAKAEELGLLPRIRFAGQRGDVSELMVGLFDAFLLPSLHEGLPLAALEAQAAGLPLLMSDRITEEAVVLPQIAYRYPLDAGPKHWAAGLRRMLESKRLSPSEACRHLAAKGFGIGTSLGRLTAHYNELTRTLCSSQRQQSLRAEAGSGSS